MEGDRHPIEGLMQTTMESIKSMVDVNTILGDPVETPDGSVIVPVSRVAFGFAAGGTEFESESGMKGNKEKDPGYARLPFGGGTGAGISLHPVAFLVVGQNQIRLVPVTGNVLYDRLFDLAPKVVDQIQSMFHNGSRRSQDRYERMAGHREE